MDRFLCAIFALLLTQRCRAFQLYAIGGNFAANVASKCKCSELLPGNPAKWKKKLVSLTLEVEITKAQETKKTIVLWSITSPRSERGIRPGNYLPKINQGPGFLSNSEEERILRCHS